MYYCNEKYICCSFYNYFQLIINSNNFLFLLQICKKNYPFQEALQFQKSIAFCYNMHTIVMMTTWVPLLLTWHISQIIVDVFSPIMSTYVFNQSKDHWLSSDALNYVIFICLKLKEESRISSYFDNFMEKESFVILELGFLASNSKKKVCGVLYFIFILKKVWKKEASQDVVFYLGS